MGFAFFFSFLPIPTISLLFSSIFSFLLASGLFSWATFGFLHLTPLTVSIGQLGAAGYGKRKSPCFCSLLFLGSLWFFLYFSCYSFCEPAIIRTGVSSLIPYNFAKKRVSLSLLLFFSFPFFSCFLSSVRWFFGGDRERGERRKEGKACLSCFLV